MDNPESTDNSGHTTLVPNRAPTAPVNENAAFLKRLLDKTCEGLAAVHDGRIRFANAALNRLLRVAPGDSVVGQPLQTFIHPRDRAALAHAAAS